MKNRTEPILTNEKIKLTSLQRIWHHFITIFLTLMGVLLFFASFRKPPRPTSATMSQSQIIITSIVMIFFALISYLWLNSRLKFSRIDTKTKVLETVETLKKIAHKNKWLLESDFSIESKQIEFTKNNFTGTPNDIVIIVNNDHILINARGNYPTDKKIVKKLMAELK